MIEEYFSAPKTIRRLRAGLSGPFIDGFADSLQQQGYSSTSVIRSLHAASHIGYFVQRRGGVLSDIDEAMLRAFGRHLLRCRCYQLHHHRKTGFHGHFGAKRFHRYLIRQGICSESLSSNKLADEPALVAAFRDWFRMHRGAAEPTLRLYSRGAVELLRALGDDVGRWTFQAVRQYLLHRASESGAPTIQKLITSLRAFLRYLSFRGEARYDLDLAIPAVAYWRLATLPRCLSANEVDRLIAACAGRSPARLRDRAIVLMLSRLGLRSGDIAQLRLSDIDWGNGTLQVMGKGRYQVCLPLPQDVGDALLRYLECRPQSGHDDRVFLRNIAPFKPFSSGDGVSSVVTRALQRASIKSPARGAHLLRHTAATEMLRNGVPLDQIGLVLRHRSIDMTAYYAKVDFALLREIAQPWPEVRHD
jgi:site-specific recombinase XerD